MYLLPVVILTLPVPRQGIFPIKYICSFISPFLKKRADCHALYIEHLLPFFFLYLHTWNAMSHMPDKRNAVEEALY